MGNHYQIATIELDVEPVPDSIVSTTLTPSALVKPVLFRFAPGQSLSEHSSTSPAVLLVLSGEGEVTLGEDRHDVRAGTWIFMPPRLLHSVSAHTAMTMLLEIIQIPAKAD